MDQLIRNKSGAASRGFSLVELLIAMAIGIMTISAVYAVVFGDQSTVVGGETNSEAVTLAQKLIENAQALGRQDFNLVNPTTTTATSGPLAYTQKVDVTLQPDFLTKLVTVTISWLGDHGQTLSTTLSTLVTNLENVNSPNTCNSVLVNAAGWKNPQHKTWDFGQLGLNGNNGNGFAVSDIRVLNKRIYITMSGTPNTDKDTVFIFSVPSDPSVMPTLIGNFDNSPLG